MSTMRKRELPWSRVRAMKKREYKRYVAEVDLKMPYTVKSGSKRYTFHQSMRASQVEAVKREYDKKGWKSVFKPTKKYVLGERVYAAYVRRSR